ncbi:unnamed protein product [Leptosia nina]|uniref:Kazal-like domain-containing protein n=1 Tax=Leptosia nina TaxID=320188 RepID=A0AAV1JGP6_9NEOP
MRLFIICVCVAATAAHAAASLLCGCPPAPPVCGSDFRTYRSECALGCENVGNYNKPVVIYRGRCEDLQFNPYNPSPYPFDPYNPSPYRP